MPFNTSVKRQKSSVFVKFSVFPRKIFDILQVSFSLFCHKSRQFILIAASLGKYDYSLVVFVKFSKLHKSKISFSVCSKSFCSQDTYCATHDIIHVINYQRKQKCNCAVRKILLISFCHIFPENCHPLTCTLRQSFVRPVFQNKEAEKVLQIKHAISNHSIWNLNSKEYLINEYRYVVMTKEAQFSNF